MNIAELTSRGWTAILRFNPELPDGKETALATRIPDWNGMSWAGQVVHRAAYGFDENGELVIGNGQLAGPETRLAVESSLAVETQGETFALPGRELPGSDERLRKILQDSSDGEPVKYDDSATVWTGEDGSVICTYENGWGIPGPAERGPVLHFEFPGKGDLHPWQENYGQQPDWSIP